MIPTQQWVFVGFKPFTNIPIFAPQLPTQYQNNVLLPPYQENTSNYTNEKSPDICTLENEINRLKGENGELKVTLQKLEAMSHNLCVTFFNENKAFRTLCNQLTYEKSNLTKARRKQNNTINVLKARLDHTQDKLCDAEKELQKAMTPFTDNIIVLQQDVTFNPHFTASCISEKLDDNNSKPQKTTCAKETSEKNQTDAQEQGFLTEEKALECSVKVTTINSLTQQNNNNSKQLQEISTVAQRFTLSSDINGNNLQHIESKNNEMEIFNVQTANNLKEMTIYSKKISHELPEDLRLQLLRMNNDLSRSRKILRQKINEVHLLRTKSSIQCTKTSNINFTLNQIQDLQEQLNEKKQLLEHIQVNYETRLSECKKNFEEELNNKERILSSKLKVGDYNSQYRIKIESNLIDARKKCIILESEVKILKESIIHMTQRNETLQKEISELKGQNQLLRDHNLQDTQLLMTQNVNLSHLDQELAKVRDEIKLLMQELQIKNEDIADLKLKESLHHDNLCQINKLLDNAKIEIKVVNDLKVEIENELKVTRMEIEELKNRNSTLLTQRSNSNSQSQLESPSSMVKVNGRRKFSRDQLLMYQTNKLCIERPLNLRVNISYTQNFKVWQVIDFKTWDPQYLNDDCEENQLNDYEPARTVLVVPTKKKNSLRDEDILKQSRSILNKLTPEKFDKLLGQFKELSINSVPRLTGIVEIIIEKASQESHFAEMYARLCQGLSELQVTKDGEKATLQTTILALCNREFDRIRGNIEDNRRNELLKQISESSDPAELKLQLEEYDMKVQKRNVGFCTFLGELFKINLIDSKILLTLIDLLMLSCNEESIECLCKTMKKIGATLEGDKCNKTLMNKIFGDIKNKLDRTDVSSSRLRFMLMDLYELRILEWIPRKKESKPVTLAEINEEVDSENTYSEPKNLHSHSQINSRWVQSISNKNNRVLDKSCTSNRSIVHHEPQFATIVGSKKDLKTLVANKPDSRKDNSPITYSKVLASKPKLPPITTQGVRAVFSLMPDYLKK